MKKILLCISLLALFLQIAQSQTASVTEGCAPLSVQFTAPDGPTTFFWDFKDGATSTLEDPANTFISAGTFVVEFRETVGGPVFGMVTITVFEQPVLDILATPASGCPPLNVMFEDNSTIADGIVVQSYEWTFGDGSPTSGDMDPAHTYLNTGAYTVSLEILTNFAGCNETEIFQNVINVTDAPDVLFAMDPNPAIACEPPLSVSFANQTPGDNLTFEWNFSNGNTSALENPPTQLYSEAGQFPITLTATDVNGCSASFSRNVFIVAASFFIPDTVCVGESVFLQNNSPNGAYSWDFGPNAVPTSSTERNPEVVFPEEGPYTVSLSISALNGACTDDTVRVIYAELPDASFTIDPEFSCSEPFDVNFSPAEGAAWSWDFGDNTTSSEQNPTHTYINEDTTTYSKNGAIEFPVSLTILTSAGCTATFEDTVVLHQPNALFMPDVVDGCAPLAVAFSDSSSSAGPILSWQYFYGDGNTQTFNNDDPHTYVFTDPGEYDVQLIITNADGCVDTSYALTIEVGEQISPDFSVDQTVICPGDTVTFTDLTQSNDIDEWHFETDNGRSFHCFQDPNLQWGFETEAGPMDVTLTVGYNGCFSSITQEDLILVNGPIALIDYEVDCTNPFAITFADSSYSASSISWDFGDTTSSAMTEIVHTYDMTGDYTVILTAVNDASGCAPSTDTATIFVRDIQAAFLLDTIICFGATLPLNASPSVDVFEDCWRGYTWDFTFNRPITTQDAVIDMVFSSPGEHTVTLITRDINACTDTTELDVTVYEVRPDFELDKDTICFPSEVTFTDMSNADTTILNWLWDFGDGAISSDTNTMHTYIGAMNVPITVALTITDTFGCMGTSAKTIEVYTPVSTILTNPFPATICTGTQVDFSASDFTAAGSNLSFSWDLGNGDTDILQNTSTIYEDEGTYFVVLNFEEVATGCPGETRDTIEVQGFPDAAFTSNLDSLPIICAPENALFNDNSQSNFPLTYQWNFGNGQMGTGANPSTSFSKGTFEVQLIASTPFGCSDTTSATYTLIAPEGNFTVDVNSICLGESITFTLQDTVDVSSFTWDFGDGTTESDVNPVTHQYNFIPPTGQTIAKLILRVENDACPVTIEQPLFIQQVIADFIRQDGIDTTQCINVDYIFRNNSINADVIRWDFGDGSTATGDSLAHQYTEMGSYEVTLIAENSFQGCVDSIKKIAVITDVFTGRALQMPNVFTPDNNNLNDVFNLVPADDIELDELTLERFQIFNRWGEVIFETDDPTQGWDGTKNGTDAPMDAYIYIIDVFLGGCRAELRGDVTILR